MSVEPWLQTYSGKVFDLKNLITFKPDIEDIAHALAHSCRFSGHCLEFYSVAQHSVLASFFARPDLKKWALLHDASEAYLSDIPRPLKPLLPDYIKIEKIVQSRIDDYFGLSGERPKEIIEMDLRLLATEKRDLMSPEPKTWGLPLPPFKAKINPLPPREAKAMFLDQYERLFKNG